MSSKFAAFTNLDYNKFSIVKKKVVLLENENVLNGETTTDLLHGLAKVEKIGGIILKIFKFKS